MLRDKRVTFLMAFGHCGLDWIHSLLDSHEQILIMPSLSFYRCWKMLDARSASNTNEMFDMPVTILEITPEMKKSVLEQGQPLFEFLGLATAGAATSKAVSDNIENNSISQSTK